MYRKKTPCEENLMNSYTSVDRSKGHIVNRISILEISEITIVLLTFMTNFCGIKRATSVDIQQLQASFLPEFSGHIYGYNNLQVR